MALSPGSQIKNYTAATSPEADWYLVAQDPNEGTASLATKSVLISDLLKGNASTALDNLASVAINTSLISDTDATDSLGSAANKWLEGFLNRITVEEGGSTTTPAAGDVALYAKADGLLYSKDDAGVETLMSGGSGGSGVGHNYIINGDCSVNQRVTAYDLTAAPGEYSWDSSNLYGPDRFEGMATGTGVTAGTFGQTTAANIGTSLTAFKFAGVTLTGTGILYIRYRMESKDAKKFNGLNASFSCLAYQDTGGAVDYTVYIRKADAADNFAAVTAISDSGAISVPNTTSTAVDYEAIAMGACSNGIEIEIKIEAGAITTKNFELTNFKFEIGDTKTDYVARAFKEELAFCQRFYNKSYPYTVAPGTASMTGGIYVFIGLAVTGYVLLSFYYPVSMRVAATIETYDGDGTAGKVWRGAEGKDKYVLSGGNNGASVGTLDATSSGEVHYQYTAVCEL